MSFSQDSFQPCLLVSTVVKDKTITIESSGSGFEPIKTLRVSVERVISQVNKTVVLLYFMLIVCVIGLNIFYDIDIDEMGESAEIKRA